MDLENSKGKYVFSKNTWKYLNLCINWANHYKTLFGNENKTNDILTAKYPQYKETLVVATNYAYGLFQEFFFFLIDYLDLEFSTLLLSPIERIDQNTKTNIHC